MGWNAISAYVVNFVFGYQSANRHRENHIALASRRAIYPLGGSRQTTVALVASAQDAVDYIDIELDGTNLAGFTVQARVEVRTLAAGTSVTPKIRNLTDSTDAGTGVACTATAADYSGSNQKQTFTVTLAAGVKKYRLMLTPSNATNGVLGIGYIEAFATA